MSPFACELTSEEMFFGAVNAIFRLTQARLSDRQMGIILELTESWKKGEKACLLIE